MPGADAALLPQPSVTGREPPAAATDIAAAPWGDVTDLRALGDLPARPLTVADLIELDVMQRGRPEVLAGGDLASRVVRWVHTSEIYEISPLLKGGEVLLTTGLGLVGCGPQALREYAVGLADRSVAALVLELGRTFARPPEALVEAAQSAGLPLVTLRGIVPFVEITETVHAMLISREVARLRLAAHVESIVTASLLAGGGLTGILTDLAALAGCPVRLYATDGRTVAASDAATALGPDAVAGPGAPSGFDRLPPPDADSPAATVPLRSKVWGRVVVCGAPTPARTLVAERGATAIAVELGRGSGTGSGPSRRRAGGLLLRDVYGRQFASVDEITGRAAALGLTLGPRSPAVGICLAVEPTAAVRGGAPSALFPPAPAGAARGTLSQDTLDAVASAAEHALGPCLVTALDGSVLLAAAARSESRAALDLLADACDAELGDARVQAVVAGPAATDVTALARSLRVARDSSLLARRLHSDRRTMRHTDLGVHRLLTRFATDPELAAFVDEQLGALLDYDAAHGRDLVRTIDTLLACGLSKAEAARALHIRRQTLYQRLETISNLLGGIDLENRERRTSLDLALVGWRLRTAGVTPA